jgi:hypothetical protein
MIFISVFEKENISRGVAPIILSQVTELNNVGNLYVGEHGWLEDYQKLTAIYCCNNFQTFSDFLASTQVACGTKLKCLLDAQLDHQLCEIFSEGLLLNHSAQRTPLFSARQQGTLPHGHPRSKHRSPAPPDTETILKKGSEIGGLISSILLRPGCPVLPCWALCVLSCSVGLRSFESL